jgi:hypothetical protein
MRRRLFETDLILAEEDLDYDVLIVVRSSVPATAAGIERTFTELMGRLRPAHKQWGLLIDTRLAPARSDPEVEAALARLAAALQRHFARMVVLVASAAGQLQAQRVDRNADGAARFSRDPGEAFEMAAGMIDVPPSRGGAASRRSR